MLCVLAVRPDPKRIAERLGDYYPGVRLPDAGRVTVQHVTIAMFLGNKARRVAVLTNVAAQANMAVVMVNSSILLHHHGSTLTAIAVAAAMHSMGMFAFSIPIGRLTDRWGRRTMLLLGGVTATIGAVMVTQGDDYWPITVGAFLVGLGWAGASIAATVVIADTTAPAQRGRCIGLNDSMTAAANILIPILAGPIAATFGVASTGILAAAVMLPALLMLALLRQALWEASAATHSGRGMAGAAET
jgi:MFS family permease